MKRLRTRALLLVLALSGPVMAVSLTRCGPGSNFTPPPNSATGYGPVTAEMKTFRDEAVALQRRPELDLASVTIQYILIANGLDGHADSKPELSLYEAEKRAAEVYQQARGGADFDKLVLTHSYGRLVHFQRPGMFTLLRGLGPDATLPNPITFRREQEDKAMTNAAWRLQPGEIGPVERHETDANSGYYIVRRLTDEEVRREDPANFPAANEQVTAMREAAAALMARPEHDATRTKVQHVLVGRYYSDSDGRLKRLSPAEAEASAAELFSKAKAGEEFETLVRAHSYDELRGDPVGSMLIVTDRKEEIPGQTFLRSGMVKGFADAAWRLNVGEIGAVIYHPDTSFYGWHIIKRLE